ncbi:hypothetical protein R3P38DRAFT_3369212 [Favolaschia claudopus]|uniref:F-box domain-containing protein n=1 Tax=Favolaschia claudopus TaxID=2862362 RepID=A0AAW0A3T7_9AGAR
MAYRNADSRSVSWPIASSQTHLNPSLEERFSALQTQMEAVHAKTEALEAKIASFQQELAVLALQQVGCQTEMTKLEHELRMARNKASHITSRLPPEILCEIFHWTLLSEEDYTRRVNRRLMLVAPWRLCRVNGHWRAVARADPHLWSRIVINCKDIYQDGYVRHCIPALEYPLAALETQLSLSHAVAISVEFHLGVSDAEQDFLHLADLLNLLIAESHRWVRLVIGTLGNPETSVLRLLSQVHGRLDRLRHLQVVDWGSSLPSSLPLALKDAFSVAPNLQEVFLPWILQIHRPTSYISLDHRQLTTLRITVAPSLVLELLSALQNVVDLALLVGYWGVEESIPGSVSNLITLPRLRRFTLDSGFDLIQHLSAPNLEILQLSDDGIKHIPALIRRSACQLQSLKITFALKNKGGLAAVIAILRLSPDLSHLELGLIETLSEDDKQEEYISLLTRLFSALTLAHAASDICAKLATFEFYIWEDETPSEFGDALCGMLESRWNMPVHQRCLRRVRMPGASHEITIWQRLEALRLDGLDIEKFFKAYSWDDDNSEDESE